MSLLNDLFSLSNTNADISKNTQTQIKFFIKSERRLTPVKHGTSIMYHNHHHANIDLKDDYCTKELICKSAQSGTNHNVPPYLQEQHKVFEPLELKQISPKLSYQPFNQFSNQYIRHQQIYLQINKYQLTNF
jgi:hypothetical protein